MSTPIAQLNESIRNLEIQVLKLNTIHIIVLFLYIFPKLIT